MFNPCHVTISHSPMSCHVLLRSSPWRSYHWCVLKAVSGGITDAFHGVFVEAELNFWELHGFWACLFFSPMFWDILYIIYIIKTYHDDVFFVSFFLGSVGNVWDFFVGGKGWGSVAAGVAQKWGVAKLPANNKGTSLHFPLLQFQCWVGHNLRPNMTISHSESVPGLILILLPWNWHLFLLLKSFKMWVPRASQAPICSGSFC